MFNAVKREFDTCHALIKAAAPLDYRPEVVSDEKIKKKESGKDELNIKFIRNPDIVEHFGKIKGDKVVVGFAAESQNIIEYAKEKLIKNNLDFIVANNIKTEGAGFKSDKNIVTIIDKDGTLKDYPIMSKDAIGKIILDKVKELFKG